MKNLILLSGFCLLTFALPAQTVSVKLAAAFKHFENDTQLRHAISSLYVIDAKTGKVIFDKNSQVGLAGASTQKIITASTAFELLGKDYRYKTEWGYEGEIKDSVLAGNMFLKGTGDPTLGSWRYATTKPEVLLEKITDILHNRKIYYHHGGLYGVIGNYDNSEIPDGWIWEDIGNYYGASAGSLNWNENQFELLLRPGKKMGEAVRIVGTKPALHSDIVGKIISGPKNSGDDAYIYFVPNNKAFYVKGSVPCCVDSFVITGAAPNSNYFALEQFANFLVEKKFKSEKEIFHIALSGDSIKNNLVTLYTHYSPSLDSIIYWFLKKSINLYGEALVKTMAYEKNGFGATDSGLVIIKKFWKEKGFDENELHIVDGSGLSPLNRITTHAQVEMLKYARAKEWFPYFYDALPEFNNMKMKSGTISGVKGFCGYQKSKKGEEYIFSFLVNNYNGSPSALVQKMYKVLDVLK